MQITLHKGEVLFHQGDTSAYLYRIISGLFKVTHIHENGNVVMFNILYPGEVVPHHSLISPQEYRGTATALTDCQVERILAKDWYTELDQSKDKALDIARLLQEKVRFLHQRIDYMAIGTPAERLKLFQEWLTGYVPYEHVTELLTQEEIGQFIGVRRETVNRLLRQQAKEKKQVSKSL